MLWYKYSELKKEKPINAANQKWIDLIDEFLNKHVINTNIFFIYYVKELYMQVQRAGREYLWEPCSPKYQGSQSSHLRINTGSLLPREKEIFHYNFHINEDVKKIPILHWLKSNASTFRKMQKLDNNLISDVVYTIIISWNIEIQAQYCFKAEGSYAELHL